ncbi:MAG: hypothetical protein ABJE47_03025 [bacterium]
MHARTSSVLMLLLALAPTLNGSQGSRGSSIGLDQQQPQPELPRIYLDTRMPAMKGKSIVVPPAGDLQAALNRAQPGDEIVLQAGATYAGSFVLPVKAGATRLPGAGPVITVRSSALASLPEGQRVAPGDTRFMARVLSVQNETHVFGTAPGTAGWRLAGLEISAAPSVTFLQRFVRLGDGNSTQNTLAAIPQNLIIDRSYIHAGPALEVKHCVDLHSGASAVVDSYIAGCKTKDNDAQAIIAYNGPGPYRIVNNYLEGSGENVMIGGSTTSVPNQVPSDIEVKHNYFAKPLSWKKGEPNYDGSLWLMKNLFELKIGQRILVEGNVFENSWENAQAGFALLLKVNNSQKLPTTDVTVRYNIIRGAAGGVNVAGIDGPVQRVAIENNLFIDVGTPRWGNSSALFQCIAVTDLSITHNTGFTKSMFLSLETGPIVRLIFRNNVVSHGDLGAKAPGKPVGLASLAAAAPDGLFSGNVLIGAPAPYEYPSNTYLSGRVESVGFTDTKTENFALTAESPFAKKATDGTNPGVDFIALMRAVAGAKP